MATKETEIELLKQHPKRLIGLYQPLLQKMVLNYVKRLNYFQCSPNNLWTHLQQFLPPMLQRMYKKHGDKTNIKTLLLEATRLLCHDFEDFHLLDNHSPQLAVKYYSIVHSRVLSYVNTRNLKESEAEDVIQTVQEKLILKIQGGQLANFQGDSLVRTFLFRVIENLIRDVLKSLRTKKAKITSSEAELKAHHAVEDSAFKSLAGKIDTEQQSNILAYLLKLYRDKDRQKFELSTKVNYQIVLKEKDLKDLNLSSDYKVELLVVFGKDYTNFSAEDLWKNLIVFTNQIDGKNNSFEALWKWFVRHRNWMTVKILFVQRYNGALQKKMSEGEKKLLSKISVRSMSKFVDDYFGEVVYAYYQKTEDRPLR